MIPIVTADEEKLNTFAQDWQESHQINDLWTLSFTHSVTGQSTKDNDRLPLTKMKQIYPILKSQLATPA